MKSGMLSGAFIKSLCFCCVIHGLSYGTENNVSIKLIKGLTTILKDSSETISMPLFIAVPESLGQIPVLDWLRMIESKTLISKKNLRFNELSEAHREFLLVIKALFQGNYPAAADGFVKLKRYKYSKELRYCIKNNKAVLYCMSGQTGFAIEEFVKMINTDHPWCEAAWRNLFSIYFGLGEYQKASSLLDLALQKEPGSKWVHVSRGYLISLLGTPEELKNYLKQKSSWKDSLYSLQIAYGRMLKNQKDYEGAIKYYNAGLEGEPMNGMAWLELSDVYYQSGYYKFASDCLSRALEAGINSPVFFKVSGQLISRTMFDLLIRQILIDRDIDKCEFSRAGYWCYEQIAKAKQVEHDQFMNSLRQTLEKLVALAPDVRELTQLLYFSYGALGMGEQVKNLKAQQWFHFTSPFPHYYFLGWNRFPSKSFQGLRIKFQGLDLPLYTKFDENEFFSYDP